MRTAHLRDARKGATHDEAGGDLLPRPEDQLSGSRGWELIDVFAQNKIDLSSTQLGCHVFAELVRVRTVEELVLALDDGDLLVLRQQVSIAFPNTTEGPEVHLQGTRRGPLQQVL